MKNKFKPGQVLKHRQSKSIWVIVDVSKPYKPNTKDFDGSDWGKTITVVGNCLYTGDTEKDYWFVGKNDTWFIDIDQDGKTKYFSDQWEIVARV